ncbi:MAG TPA: enoyl-ACP reductase [Dehalococcoidia bacterium]|jgi:enoyl-[acyl-carrier protein] reductase I|nr:enoyl-ACP reductase [Nevskia sp.]MDI3260942.1 enoyl-ACP reductase [Nevskiaceae bacterium]HZU76477.1 enoyl-ACP reductase [Dehalococcoidia bacterium]
MGFLNGKKALITGVASERSIATGIAEAFHREGAELAFTYQGDKLKPRVEDLAHSLNSTIVLPLDVTRDVEIDAVFETLKEKWGALDILVHSIGYAPRELLAGSYLDTVTRQGYAIAHDISAYSFAALAKGARPLMRDRKGALLTLTYLGSQRFVPMYNVMGAAKASLEANVRYLAAELGPLNVRVNAISAGPIKTLAAAGIKGFRSMLAYAEKGSALKRNVTIEEVGNAAAFLCSDLASGITGEILYVDAGFNIMGFSLEGAE